MPRSRLVVSRTAAARTARRLTRTAGLSLLALAGLTCRDRSLTGPGLSVPAKVRLATSFQAPVEGGPQITLTRVRAVLEPDGGGDSVVAVADFQGDVATLTFNLQLLNASQLFRYRIAAVDATGDTLFRAGPQTVLATAGSDVELTDVTMRYAGPDARIQTLTINPAAALTLAGGATQQFAVSGVDSSGSALSNIRVGWTVKDASAGTVGADGRMTASMRQSATWVVARTYTGIADSVLVTVRPPVAAVDLVQSSMTVMRGESVPLSVRLFDVSTPPVEIPLEGRTVTWTSSNPAAVSVDPSTGVITALVTRDTSWIVAASEGKRDSIKITVGPRPVSAVVATPDSVDVIIGQQLVINASAFDDRQPPQPNDDFPIVWSSSDLSRATISATAGTATVSTLALGRVVIRASAGGGATPPTDSVVIRIVPVPVGSTVLTPEAATIYTGESVQLTAEARDANGAVLSGRAVSFSSLEPNVATVTQDGLVNGLTVGVARIVATIEGKADTSTITVRTRFVLGITPRTATAYSLGDTLVFQAGATGQGGDQLPPFTWVSRDPSVLQLIDASGDMARFRALANGTTRVVVSEPGGSADSAAVTVQQRVASVSVTPSVIQRYLGTRQQFSATALDARGNAMPSATFTWSSSSNVVSMDSEIAGLAHMSAIGSATVRATSGEGAAAVTGQAQVTVITAISRIVVSPATATLNALGATQAFVAEARDTLDAPMSGVTFTWASSNPSVAQLVSSTATATTARADANGFTAVRASAQGVTGEGRLTVQQVLAGIAVSPPSAIIGVGGTLPLMVRGADANGRPMAVGAALWSSSAPSVASVGASSGVVTGLALTQTPVTITATVGGLTASSAVSVSNNNVPLRVYFGRDTVALGRGTTQQIPVYLSAPAPGPVTVNLRVRDTIAYFTVGQCNSTVTQACQLTIPQGTSSAQVTITARNAGVSDLYVTDAANAYDGDTATLVLQANVRMSFGNVQMNNGDQFAGQVILSDPAPAGGVYVTYAYGTAGRVQVSPDPAFIPQGQLRADVVVRALAPGSTTITPSALGVAGANSPTVTVDAAALRWGNAGTVRIGTGQQQVNYNYVYLPNNTSTPVTVTLTSTDSTVAKTTQSQVVIPAGTYYQYVHLNGFTHGSTTITATAANWAAAGHTVVVTTPRLDLCCNQSTNTTVQSLDFGGVSVQDSVFSGHARISALVVRLTSSDTTVVKLIDSVVTIQAGQTSANTLRARPVGGGRAWIYARVGEPGASGYHFPDSVRIDVAAPALSFGSSLQNIGAGQYAVNANYVQIPNPISTPLTVTLTAADPSIATPTANVVIPAGTYYGYFELRGHRAGTTTYTATASGYSAATATVRVTTPRVSLCCNNNNVPMYAEPFAIHVTTQDTTGSNHPVQSPVTFTLRAVTQGVVSLDYDTVTVAAGQASSSVRRVRPVAPGTTLVIAEAPGYIPDTITYRVNPAPLGTGTAFSVTAAGHIHVNGNYVTIPNQRGTPVTVTITQRRPDLVQLSSSTVTIPGNSYYAYFHWEGIAPGEDTLTFSAEGYTSTTSRVRVSSRLLRGNDLPSSALTTTPPQTMRAYTVDTVGNQRAVRDTVTVRMRSTDPTVLQVDSAYVHIVRGQSQSTPNTVRYVNPGRARLIYEDSAGRMAPDTTREVVITGPSLRFGSTALMTTGIRQRAPNANYVYVDNNVTQPLTVYLNTSDSTQANPIARVPRSVTIPTGTYYAYFNVDGGDSTGTVAVIASTTGYQSARVDVQVGQPCMRVSTDNSQYTTSLPGTITVQLYDQTCQNPRQTLEDLPVDLLSSAPNVAAPDSARITIRAGQSAHNTARMRYLSPGTTRLTVADARTNVTPIQRYVPGNAQYPGFTDVAVATPYVRIAGNMVPLAPGQWHDYYVEIPVSRTQAQGPLTVTLSRSTQYSSMPATVTIPVGTYYVYFRVTGQAIGNDVITVSAPNHAASTHTQEVSAGTIEIENWPNGALPVGSRVQIRLQARNRTGDVRPLAASTNFTLAPDARIRFMSAATGGTEIREILVSQNTGYSGYFWVEGVQAGPATATFSSAGYTTLTKNTVVP